MTKMKLFHASESDLLIEDAVLEESCVKTTVDTVTALELL